MSEYKIKITLKSDLCPGSGYAYSGLIDSDVCFDDYGIPYIPGRRLKGCFKESADMLVRNGFFEKDYIHKIFGKSGSEKSGSLLISNAYIEGYKDLCKDLEGFHISTVTRQRILEQFTSVKAQTKLKDGVALDDTLRYTRVVNKAVKAFSEKELSFISEISLDDKYKDDFKKILKSTRNIGMDRNRGLGSVVCKYEEDEKTDFEEKVNKIQFSGDWDKTADEEKVSVKLRLKNTAPLMISGDNDEVSLSYIPAQSLIGFLAGKYLQNNSYGEEFEDLFLNGTTCYSNLIISGEGKNKEYIPAPSFINRLKKTGKYVNILKAEDKDGLSEGDLISEGLHTDFVDKEKTISGNMPKKLKGKYVSLSDDKVIDTAETEMFIDYHHSKKGGKGNSEPVLYTNQVIKEGQLFSGNIIIKRKYLGTLRKLLETNVLRFGKSKSAQYGSCQLLEAKVEEYKEEKISLKSGDTIMLVLTSDGIFMNDNDYTVRYDEVREQIAEAIKLKSYQKDDEKLFSFVTTSLTFGYNTKWNLRKQPVPMITAGSTFVYMVNEACEIELRSVGERNHEGFGSIRIFKNVSYDMNQKDDTDSENTDSAKLDKNSNAAKLIKNIINEELLKCLPDVKMRFEADNTQLGRLTLMLKESNKEGDFISNYFCNRVNNIKSDDIKRKVISWLKGTKLFDKESKELKLKTKDFKWNKAAEELFSSYETVVDDTDFRGNFLDENMYSILMTYLTNEKYMVKIKENKNNKNKEASENE